MPEAVAVVIVGGKGEAVNGGWIVNPGQNGVAFAVGVGGVDGGDQDQRRVGHRKARKRGIVWKRWGGKANDRSEAEVD
jgi:hypothetical protein